MNFDKILDYLTVTFVAIVIFSTGLGLNDIEFKSESSEETTHVDIVARISDPVRIPTITATFAVETEEVGTIEVETFKLTAPEEVLYRPATYDYKRFKVKPVRTRDIALIRQEVYTVAESCDPAITSHKGGEELDSQLAYETVREVLNTMPNLEKNENLYNLIFETLIVESNVGGSKYEYAAKNWRNYGIAQIREDTAEDTLKWLGIVRPDVKQAVMSFYDDELTMQENLLTNVPFSIAMAAQYYWRAVGDLDANITTLADRAKMWKSFYNGPGAGTVNIYITRVLKYYDRVLPEETVTVAKI